MRPVADARLRNREPEPGLLNLPIPLHSIPILSPILTPLVAGKNQQSPPSASPQPAPAPAPPPQSKPLPLPTPPAIIPPIGGNPNKGGGGGGGGGGGSSSPPESGGNSGDGGNGGGNGNSSPPSSGNGGGSNTPSGGGGGDASNQQGGSQSNPPSDSSPSPPPSGTSAGSVSPIVSGGTTFTTTPTGVAAMPVNDNGRPDLAAAASSSSTPGSPMQSGLGQSSTVALPSAASITPAGKGASGAVSVGPSGSPGSGKGDNGNGQGSSSPDSSNASSSASHSLSRGAIGGIAAVVVIASAVFLFFVLRRRYIRRRAERRVEWINGYVSGNPDMQQVQRQNSMRSSWGTPIEHRFSDPFRWSMGDGRPKSPQEEAEYSIETAYAYAPDDRALVLPMPVHTPTACSFSPEDPFGDAAAPQRQPIKPMSSLPIRISLLSTGSGNRDPFDDINGYKADEHASDSEISSATFGHRADANNGIGAEANFPLPPTSAGSTPTVYAIGSRADLLQPPGILISFPDSPVSPTFAASGTSSYPRRASVKQPFQPSHKRGDEVPLVKDDLVSVISVYEDGWAFVQNEKSNARGLAPLNCLEIDNP